MANKITIAENYDKVISVLEQVEGSDDLIAFIKDRKEKSKKKVTEKKKSEDAIKVRAILEEILTTTPRTVSALQKSDSRLADFSNQRITNVLGELIADKVAVRVVVKGSGAYALTEDEDGEDSYEDGEDE